MSMSIEEKNETILISQISDLNHRYADRNPDEPDERLTVRLLF